MNRLFLPILVLMIGLAAPAASSASEASGSGATVSTAPYCGSDSVCPPPTWTCDISTDESPKPTQEDCVWLDEPPYWTCADGTDSDEPEPSDPPRESQVNPDPSDELLCGCYSDEPGSTGGSEDPAPADDDSGEATDPGFGFDEAPDADPGDQTGDEADGSGDPEYCIYAMDLGGPKVRKNYQSGKAERTKAKHKAAKARQARIKARKAKKRAKAKARAKARAVARR